VFNLALWFLCVLSAAAAVCALNPLQGPYDQPDGFQMLSSRLSEQEAVKPRANRMFFLSIPPNVFLSATGNAADHARSK
jgi:glucose-6-phosphate 1-dehydrogenase